MIPPLYKDVDFTLLRALHALLEERSVTGAARRLGVSQPAASRSLQKLRAHFGDPLLVRKLGGMVPTPRAEEMVGPLRHWLAEGEALFRPRMEAPESLQRVFRIASTDYGIISVIGPALARIAEAAPEVSIMVLPLTQDATERLKNGELDLIVTGYEPDTSIVHARWLFTERYTCLARSGHPIFDLAEITPEAFFGWPQIVFTVLDLEGSRIDSESASAPRKVMLWTQNAGVMPLLARQSDAIAMLPRRAAMLCTQGTGLREFAPPVAVEEFGYWLLWHERNRRDPAIGWLIERLADVAAGQEAAG